MEASHEASYLNRFGARLIKKLFNLSLLALLLQTPSATAAAPEWETRLGVWATHTS